MSVNRPAELRSRRRCAFTMLELMVVVLLVGLLATVVVLAIKPTLDRAVLQRTIDAIESADLRERAAAMTSPFAGGMIVDAGKNVITFRLSRRTVTVPGDWQIEGPRIGAVGSTLSGMTASGTRRVRYFANGQSDSYAIGMRQGQSREQSQTHWLVVAGLSGQASLHVGDDLVDRLMGRR